MNQSLSPIPSGPSLAVFAHLRAVAEGLPVEASARRYLGVDIGGWARTAHRQAVERVRAIARRRGDPRWRLVGLTIAAAGGARPSMEDWAAEQGLDGWSQAELLQLYREAHPVDRREARNARLRKRQVLLLVELERSSAAPAEPTDLLHGWLDPGLAERLRRCGLLTLADLQQRMRSRKSWWDGLPAIGRTKAARIAGFVSALLAAHSRTSSDMVVTERSDGHQAVAVLRDAEQRPGMDGREGTNRAPLAHCTLTANNDRDAIEAWIRAKAGAPGSRDYSPQTERAYRREGERLLLWALAERRKPLSSLDGGDCSAYLDFLQHLPSHWVSAAYAERWSPGWTPFSKPVLSPASRQYAVKICSSLCDWLASEGYLRSNPFNLIRRKVRGAWAASVHSRALDERAWNALLAGVEAEAPSPARARALFVLRYGEATGLRASELLEARLGDLARSGSGWVQVVVGKGDKERTVAVPSAALSALGEYLAARGLPPIDEAPPEAPLVARIGSSMEPLSYPSLYQSMRETMQRAFAASDLPRVDRDRAMRATLHWLRHTHGTRATERGVPIDVLAAQLGHVSINTTARYSRAQLQRQQAHIEAAFPKS